MIVSYGNTEMDDTMCRWQHLQINLTGTSHLDFTGVIEEHNEVHHRQRLMELPVRNPHSIFSFLH